MTDHRDDPARLDIESFRRRHAAWLSRVADGPLYCLPEAAIHRLGQPHVAGPILFDQWALRAERDLSALCHAGRFLGFDNARPIAYPGLTPTLPLPPRHTVPGLNWTDAEWRSVESVLIMAGRANERLAGYAGWLLTDPGFIANVANLAERWRGLPDPGRPVFPLLRPSTRLDDPAGWAKVPEITLTWVVDFTNFCDRWGLVGMATWDLPSPQGPLLPSLVPNGSPILPTQAVTVIVPIHYHLTGDHDLMGTILEQQRALAAECGLDPTIAGLPHYKHYAQILKVVHLERAIGSRFARVAQPRGLIRAMTQAIAEAIGQTYDQVKRLRSEISRCRRGQRSQVNRLQLPKA